MVRSHRGIRWLARLSLRLAMSAWIQALDDFVLGQLSGIERTFNELSERLGDPDVLSDPKKIMEVSQERASIEEVRCQSD